MYAFLMAYAHAVIEYPDLDGETVRIERGASVNKADIPGVEELVEAGSIGEDKPEPVTVDEVAPDTIELAGVVYKRASDGASTGEASS